MRFCEQHWRDLKQAIDDRGMVHLVSKDGQTAIETLLEAPNDVKSFDPLLIATMEIYGTALRYGGAYLAIAKEDGTRYCPLCELVVHKAEEAKKERNIDNIAKHWIDGCTDFVLKEARELGLMPKPS